MNADVSVPDALPSPVEKSRPAQRTFVRRLTRGLERCLAILGLFFLIYFFGFDLSVMVSGSMSPTLCGDGNAGSDYVLSEHVTHLFSNPKRWDLVSFHSSEGVLIMKRVVGLPRETVAMTSGGDILINGKPSTRPKAVQRVVYFPYGNMVNGHAVETGEGYFVLGDDSKDSDDSRYNPPLQQAQIAGRPFLIVWPLSRTGFVNP